MSNSIESLKKITGIYFYSEALDWFEKKLKHYKSLENFLQSNEFDFVVPLIRELAWEELKNAGLKIGDKVMYEEVNLIDKLVHIYTGKIIEKYELPFVKLDGGKNLYLWWTDFKLLSPLIEKTIKRKRNYLKLKKLYEGEK
jgi:hypothetical protein